MSSCPCLWVWGWPVMCIPTCRWDRKTGLGLPFSPQHTREAAFSLQWLHTGVFPPELCLCLTHSPWWWSVGLCLVLQYTALHWKRPCSVDRAAGCCCQSYSRAREGSDDSNIHCGKDSGDDVITTYYRSSNILRMLMTMVVIISIILSLPNYRYFSHFLWVLKVGPVPGHQI